MPYFLQQYKPQEPVTKAREDGTGGGSNRESPAAISGSSTSHGNQCKRSAVNKIYTLAQKLEVLQYVRTHFEAEAARHFEIPRTTIQGWKGLDRQPIDRKKSRRKSGRTKLKLAAFSHTVKTWRMNYHGGSHHSRHRGTETTIHCNFDLYSTREDASAICDLQGKDLAHLEEDHNQRMPCYHDNPTQGMDGPQTDADMDQKGSRAAHQRVPALLVFVTFKATSQMTS